MKQFGAMIILLVLTVTLAAAAPAAPPAASGDTAAQVYNEKISRSQLVDELLARYGSTVLTEMIENVAIEHYAQGKGIRADEAIVDQQVAAARTQIEAQAQASGATFAVWLAQRGLTEESFRQQFRNRELLRLMVQDNVKVDDQEIARFYEENKQKMVQEEAVYAANINLQTQPEAQKVRDEITSGKITWEAAAKKYSIDPYGRDNGGLVGWVVRSTDPVRQAIFALKNDGDMTEVVQNVQPEAGWSIFKRLQYRPAGVPPFEQVQDQIKELLFSHKLLDQMQTQRTQILQLADPQVLIKFPSPTPAPPAAAH